MARKRKQSKGREKQKKERTRAPVPEGASPAETSETEPSSEEPPGKEVPQDASRTEEVADDGQASDESGDTEVDASEPEAKVAAVIDVDEELDDPEAQAELVALAAGLEVSDTPAGSEAGGEAHVADDSEDGDAADEDGAEEAEDEEAPLIGRAALVALTQFRDEGVATIPEELVLDLGDAASTDERDRLLAAALAHAEMQEAIYRVPVESGTSRRWKGLIAAALFALALLVIPLPPAFLVPAGPQPLSTAERERGLRTALLLQAEQIEAFRAREDRLPRSLAEVETALPGVRYIRSSGRLYQLLTYTPDGEAIIFDSAAPGAEFDGLGSVLTDGRSS